MEILPYDPSFQPAINEMMKHIQDEFKELITTSHSTVIIEVYKQPDQKFWVALHDNNVAGTIGIKLFGSRAEIKRMFVHPDYRGPIHKTAKMLFEQAFKFARQVKCTEVYLGTMTQFKAAQRFY